MSRREPADPLYQAVRRSLIVIVGKIALKQLAVRLHHREHGDQRLHLRGKRKPASLKLCIKQRLHAKTVPRQKQALFLPVPDCKRPHAVKAVHAALPPLTEGCQDHLRIAVAAEGVSFFLKLPADLDKIVDFPVECQPVAPVCIGHWLASGIRQIQNGKPPVPQRHTALLPQSRAVRSAVRERVQAAHRELTVSFFIDHTINSTHIFSPVR